MDVPASRHDVPLARGRVVDPDVREHEVDNNVSGHDKEIGRRREPQALWQDWHEALAAHDITEGAIPQNPCRVSTYTILLNIMDFQSQSLKLRLA